MTKNIEVNTTQKITTWKAPERVAPSLPANAVRLADLCNGGDIVLRGPGKPFQTENGLATPVFYQEAEDFEPGGSGPIALEGIYAENGDYVLTGKALSEDDMTEDDVPRNVYQFITSSVVILRAARHALKEGAEGSWFVSRVETKRSVSTGRDYYVLV